MILSRVVTPDRCLPSIPEGSAFEGDSDSRQEPLIVIDWIHWGDNMLSDSEGTVEVQRDIETNSGRQAHLVIEINPQIKSSVIDQIRHPGRFCRFEISKRAILIQLQYYVQSIIESLISK
jgi:hypothetical protein